MFLQVVLQYICQEIANENVGSARYQELCEFLLLIYKQQMRRRRAQLITSLACARTRYREPFSIPRTRYQWMNDSPQNFRQLFRFEKDDLVRLREALQIPEKFVTSQRHVFTGEEALLVVLRVLSFPARGFDLMLLFGRDRTALVRCYNELMEYLHNKWRTTIQFDQERINAEQREVFVEAGIRKGMPEPLQVWGYIDGTLRAVGTHACLNAYSHTLARPQDNQQVVYSGHYRDHGLKYQGVATPDGVLSSLSDAYEGCRNDQALLQLEEHVRHAFESFAPHRLFGDPGYNTRFWLIAPFKGAHVTEEEEAFNKCTSRCRICVEWLFGHVVTLWQGLNWTRTMQLGLRPVAIYYRVGVLLANCYTCLYGNQTSIYFGIQPPELEEYLSHPC